MATKFSLSTCPLPPRSYLIFKLRKTAYITFLFLYKTTRNRNYPIPTRPLLGTTMALSAGDNFFADSGGMMCSHALGENP
jgi:hypothetical protein